jgi:hypothetical protein
MAAYETRGQSDDWYTPAYIFDALGEHFYLDVAAAESGPRYVPWLWRDGLSEKWSGFVWMNPPFGQHTKRVWLAKFFEHGNGVALVPDRTSAPWFQEFAPLADALLFLSTKVKFERPDGSIGESPGTGTVLMATGPRASAALHRASALGVIIVPTGGISAVFET